MSSVLLIVLMVICLAVIIYAIKLIKENRKTIAMQKKRLKESRTEDDIYKPL